MGAFEYTALEPSGRERKGRSRGRHSPPHSSAAARAAAPAGQRIRGLAERGQTAKRLRPAPAHLPADLALFTRQLATLVRAGLPLEEALLAVSQQTERPRVQSIILGSARARDGGPYARGGLAEFPRVFPEIYRATISAGEQSGYLDAILERLADYTENREALRQRVLGAMLYPIVLSVMCFAIVSGLLVFVVPKVVAVFEASRAKAADHDARADCHQRVLSRLRHLDFDRRRHRSGFSSCAACAIRPRGAAFTTCSCGRR
jgi:general secretion pathway protein F